MVRAGRIAGSRADAAITLADQLLDTQLLVVTIAKITAGLLVEQFGKGLGKAVGQRLGHDRAIVVMVAQELRTEGVEANAGRHGKGAKVVGTSALPRGNEVGQ